MTSLGGCDLTPPTDLLSVSPPPVAIVRLQRLHTAAVRLAKEAPEIIANPQAAYGLEQALLEAMIDCLSKGAVEGQGGPAAAPALSRCRAAVRKVHGLNSVQASTAAACQCATASALNFRKVDREIRWRWR